MWDSLSVNGFSFDSTEEYNEARKESEAIDYICSKMDIHDPKTALKVYYKLLERQNLHTIIGFTFLKELRDSIISSGIVDVKSLKPIKTTIAFARPAKNVNDFGDEDSLEQDTAINAASNDIEGAMPENQSDNTTPTPEELEKKREENFYREKEKKLHSVIERYKVLTKKCYIVIAALAIIVIALFTISLFRNSLDITDSEAMLQDRYAGWAEQLTQKEAELAEREALLARSE